MNYQQVLDEIFLNIRSLENVGKVASYIPELSKVNPDQFGVCLKTLDGIECGVGDWKTKFSIQSICKVLTLSYAYKILGDKIWERVGVEPSGNPFNSLVQLETDNGIPRNPLINAGAMVICDMLLSQSKNAQTEFIDFVRKISNNPNIDYSYKTAQSEKSIGYRNIALCNFIKSFGNIRNEPIDVLEFYFHICSIEMSCQELVQTFMFLVSDVINSKDNQSILEEKKAVRVNAIMQTCGFYDESGEFSFRVGLPGKSGVGGGIVALHPEKYCIAVWSPRLNAKGNSFRGMKFLESFTSQTNTNIF